MRRALLVIVVTALCRAPAFWKPFLDGDEGQYASIAALINAGGRPYLDGGVENKFPGIYWTYAAVFRLFGRFAMRPVQALVIVTVLVTALVLARIATRLGGRGAGFLAALFYGVFTTVYYPKMLAANTEIFMMLPLAASMLFLYRGRFFAAGLLVGVACLWKQVAIVNLVVVGWAARRQARLAAHAAAGFGLALGAAAAVLWAQGSLGGLWRWAVVAVFARFGMRAWSPLAVAGQFVASFLPFVGATLLLWAGASAAAVRHAKGRAPELGLALAWLGASFVGASVGGHFFGHYFIQLIGPLALLAGLEIERHLPRLRVRALVAAGTALPALGFALVALAYEPWSDSLGRPPRDFAAVAADVRARTAPDDRIFVWGMSAQLYLAAQRLPATRFVGFLRGLDRGGGEPPEKAWDCAPDVWPLVEADFAAHPPALLVDTSAVEEAHFIGYPLRRFPVLARYFADYEPVATIEGVTIARRRGK